MRRADQVGAPAGNFPGPDLDSENVAVGAKSFECVRMTGEETVAEKRPR